METSRFSKERRFDERVEASQKILKKYPHMVPIICEPARSSTVDVTTYHNSKYVVPRESKLGNFLMRVRSELNIAPENAVFIFANNTLPPISALIGDIYEKHKSSDGFLYFEFSGENVFGHM